MRSCRWFHLSPRYVVVWLLASFASTVAGAAVTAPAALAAGCGADRVHGTIHASNLVLRGCSEYLVTGPLTIYARGSVRIERPILVAPGGGLRIHANGPLIVSAPIGPAPAPATRRLARAAGVSGCATVRQVLQGDPVDVRAPVTAANGGTGTDGNGCRGGSVVIQSRGEIGIAAPITGGDGGPGRANLPDQNGTFAACHSAFAGEYQRLRAGWGGAGGSVYLYADTVIGRAGLIHAGKGGDGGSVWNQAQATPAGYNGMSVADTPGDGGPGGDARLIKATGQIAYGYPGLGGKAGDATAYAGDGGEPNCDGGNTLINVALSGAMGNGKKSEIAVRRSDVTVGGGNGFGALHGPPGYPQPGLPGGHGGSVSIIGGTPYNPAPLGVVAFLNALRITNAGNGGPGGDGCGLTPQVGGDGGRGGDLNSYFDHIAIQSPSTSNVQSSFNGGNGGDGGGFGRGGQVDAGPASWLSMPVAQSFNPGRDGNPCPVTRTTTPGTFTLTVTMSGTGSGSVKGDLQSGIVCPSPNPSTATCQTTVPSGTVVSLVPFAAQGSVFDGWTGACQPLTTVNCQITVTQNMTVTAIFNLASTPPPRTAQGVLTNGDGSRLAYSVQTNLPANAFELILPSRDHVTTFGVPAGFTSTDCTSMGNVETCTGGTVTAGTALIGTLDHTGTISSGEVEVAFSSDNGASFSPIPPAALTGPTNPSSPPQGYQCVGTPFVLFSNWNTGAVANGGTEPTFDTGGTPYCLVSLSDYHYNDGLGVASAGTIGLLSETSPEVGPYQSLGSSPGGVPNADWTATVGSESAPVVIDGAYACTDSDPLTWSQNAASGGQGFCSVTVQPAQPTP
jgi:uncharacterized repeat protein (TIGR02543 family)